MAEIHGTVTDERFAQLGELLAASIDAETDLGGSVAVTIDGELVVDIWGGYVDPERTTPWAEDTITNVWSTTKTMSFLCMLMLADRGQLDFREPVSTYWPEFAANGKESVEVRHLMGHTSGVPAWDTPVDVADLYDFEAAAARLAGQAPWIEPGTTSSYHAVSQGHLLGEVLRRIDGRTMGTFFAEEIAGPLGADFFIGTPESEFGRITNVIPPPPSPIDITTIDPEGCRMKTILGPRMGAEVAWTPEWRTAEIPAANGHGNARSVARIQAIVANGGTLDGITFLSPETIEVIFDEQANGTDEFLDELVRFGMGYALPSAAFPLLPDRRIGYWGGWGGSSIVVDVDRRMTFAYMMNRMDDALLGDERGDRLAAVVFDNL